MIIVNSLILLVIIVACDPEETKVDSSDDKPATTDPESKNANKDDNSASKKDDKETTKEPAVPIPSLPPYRTSIFILPLPDDEDDHHLTGRETATVKTSEILATTIGQVFSVMIDHDDQSSNIPRAIAIKAYNGDTVVDRALININNITGNNNFYQLSANNPLPVTFYLFFTAKALEDMVNRLVILIDGKEVSVATVRLSANNKTLTAEQDDEDDEDLVFSLSPLPGGSAVYLRYFKLLAVDNNGQRDPVFDTIRDTARLQDELDQQHYRLTISDFPCQAGKRVFAWQPENNRGEIIPSVERFYYQTTCP